MVSSKDFFEKIIDAIDAVSEAERETIYKAAQMMGDCMDENGVVQLFGLGHGLEFSMELGYRAGGLMPFHKVQTRDLALRGVISEAELFDPEFDNNVEMAHKLLGLYRIDKEDMFLLVSDSGCEAIIVEVAKIAKEQGRKTIAVISKKARPYTEYDKKLNYWGNEFELFDSYGDVYTYERFPFRILDTPIEKLRYYVAHYIGYKKQMDKYGFNYCYFVDSIPAGGRI